MVIAFESSLEEWSKINFDDWKKHQHEAVRRIDDEETAVMNSRRALVKQTKEMKQSPEGEQNLKMAELLRLYQQEIDGLGNRLKSSFALFRESVLPMIHLSDPLPAMQVGLEQTEQLADLEMLQRENTNLALALEASNALCHRQAKQIEDSHRFKDRIDELSQTLEVKEANLQKVQERLSHQEKECIRLQTRNEQVGIELGRLRKANEDLLKDAEELRSTKSQQETIKVAEFEVVGLNLENTRRQVVELQRENQLLRLETASLKQNEPVVDSRKIAELEDDLLDLQTKLEEEQAKRKKGPQGP